MLNHNLHGPGNTWENLTILSQKGNRNHLDAAENPIKIAVDSGAIVKYHVIADYKGSREAEVSDAQLEAAGIDPSKWEDIREIKRFENTAVPEQLMLTARQKPPCTCTILSQLRNTTIKAPNARLAGNNTCKGNEKKIIKRVKKRIDKTSRRSF
ncbi:MAG: hypothetical protein AAF551_11795 [Bacteroidota bacterium]